MMLSSFLSPFRLVAAALIACAFLIAPMAEAEHVQIETATACDTEHGDGDTDHGEHDHHAHNCGPCLIHLLRRDSNSECIFQAGIQSIRPLLSEDLVSLPPGSLYRPPRA